MYCPLYEQCAVYVGQNEALKLRVNTLHDKLQGSDRSGFGETSAVRVLQVPRLLHETVSLFFLLISDAPQCTVVGS